MISEGRPNFGLNPESDWSDPKNAVAVYFYRLSQLVLVTDHYNTTGELILDSTASQMVCDDLKLTMVQFEELFVKGAQIIDRDPNLNEFHEDFHRRTQIVLEQMGIDLEALGDHMEQAETQGEADLALLNELWALPFDCD